jgi:hypothetical protein
MPHYWRGLFDGDGGFCKSAGNYFAKICGTEACVDAFAAWGRLICGSQAKVVQVRPGVPCWQWQVAGVGMTQLLARALYENAPVALDRKLLLAQELCAIDVGKRKAEADARRAAAMRNAWIAGRFSARARKT